MVFGRAVFFVFLFAVNASAEDCFPLKSLHSIYGTNGSQVPPAKVTVGVIGSGIDYNHPGLARFLSIRHDFEEKLINIEKLPEVKNLTACEYQEFQQNHNIGFPQWMDQALHSTWPMDQVFRDGVLQPDKDHETRVTSRIIEGRGDVAVHFVRRMYGNQIDILNVAQVLENFSARGVQVVNMSFGSDCGVLPVEEQAWSQLFKMYPQIIFVISAGNSGRNLDYFDYCPAKFSRENVNVISVTSVTSDGVLSINTDPETGREILMNYGVSVDLAIRADALNVLAPLQYDGSNFQWINHATGWTSHAAAEVSRVIVHAMADGYRVSPQAVKEQLIRTSRKNRYLKDFVKSSGVVDENAFRASFTSPQ